MAFRLIDSGDSRITHVRGDIGKHFCTAQRCTLMAVSLLLAWSLAACVPPATPRQEELVVFAAASLTDAFTEIGEAFGARNHIEVTFNFAGSQTLAGQLTSGAPADVFASASDRQMQFAIDGERVDPSAVFTFAANRLVIVTPRENPGAVVTPVDLAFPGLKIVLADAAVPAGNYSLQFLAKASSDPAYTTTYSIAVLSNVVSYEENVRAVLAKIVLGEADAAIVYSSDVAGEQRDSVQIVEIPTDLNVVAAYQVAPVIDSDRPTMARIFVDFLLSPTGQSILNKHGFQRVKP